MSWLRRRLLHDLLTEHHEDPALADPAFAVFLEARQRVTPWPEVEGILASWARRYRIAAITNGNADVHRTPLGRYFSASISAPAFGAAKPDPRIFHAACDALGVEPGATLHIGDDLELDVLAPSGGIARCLAAQTRAWPDRCGGKHKMGRCFTALLL